MRRRTRQHGHRRAAFTAPTWAGATNWRLRDDPLRPDKHPYQQLARQLREQIESGKITSALSSITDLAAETGLAVGARAAPSASS